MKPALRWLQALWYAASMYLPVVLIVLLALGTWWLARNTPVFSTPVAEQAVKHEPDYFMRNFAVKNFDAAGLLQSEVAGAEGRHFPDTDVLEIDSARIRSFKKDQRTTATANRAYSNGDGSEVQLVGNAVVVREPVAPAASGAQPKLEFRGEFLHVFLKTEQVNSHKSVTITRGGDQFVADSLQYDNLSRVALLQGRVKGTLVPRSKGTP
jgi:lipopolysaccharide export system protein LptC